MNSQATGISHVPAPPDLVMTIDEWAEKYRPLDAGENSSGELDFNGVQAAFPIKGPGYESVQEALKEKPDCVWTLIECDGERCITNGWHFVNREAYLITEVPGPGPREGTVSAYDEIPLDERTWSMGNNRSLWITSGDISVAILKKDDVVTADLYRLDEEMEEPLASYKITRVDDAYDLGSEKSAEAQELSDSDVRLSEQSTCKVMVGDLVLTIRNESPTTKIKFHSVDGSFLGDVSATFSRDDQDDGQDHDEPSLG